MIIYSPPPQSTIRRAFVFSLFLGLFVVTPAKAQFIKGNYKLSNGDSIHANLSGTFQPVFSYVDANALNQNQERVGLGIRRARIMLNFDVNKRLIVFGQTELSTATGFPFLLDFSLKYRLFSKLWVRTGRFIGAQPRSFGYTIHNVLDGVNRASIAEKWANKTRGGDGRDFGVEVSWETKQWETYLFLHNGHNQENFRTGISNFNPAANSDDANLALSLFTNFKPEALKGVEFGGYFGRNTDKNPNTEMAGIGRRYTDYSFHLYYGALPGSQPLRAKFDFIGIDYDQTQGVEQKYRGYSGLAALRIKKVAEIFQRVEFVEEYESTLVFNAVDDRTWILESGLTFSMAALKDLPFNRNRFTLVFANKNTVNPLLGRDVAVQLFYQLSF